MTARIHRNRARTHVFAIDDLGERLTPDALESDKESVGLLLTDLSERGIAVSWGDSCIAKPRPVAVAS